MAKVALPSEQCKGLDLPDGTKYNSKEGGFVEVRNPDHLRALEASGFRARDAFAFRAAAGVECRGCHFEQLIAYADKPCPRCGERFE